MFAVAAQHGNLRQAARELNLSQGAVSQRIKQLEQNLGVALFERQPRGVSLTGTGETYFGAVEEALAIIDGATANLTAVDKQITMHVGPSTGSKWLMPRLSGFNARYPDIRLSTEVHYKPMTRGLGRNEVAIWPGQVACQMSSHHVRFLTELKLVAVCSPDLQHADGVLSLEDMMFLTLLQDQHRRWDRLIKSTGCLAIAGLLNFGSSALAVDAALKGHGVAIAPSYMVEDDIDSKRLIKIFDFPDTGGKSLFLSWARQHSDDWSLQKTVDWVLNEFRCDQEY